MRKRMIVPIRAFLYISAISPLVALATSLLTSSPAHALGNPSRRWEVLCDLSVHYRLQQHPRFFLLDRLSGEANALALPAEEQWGMVSVAPWCDPEGNAEAVGHCYIPSSGGIEGDFWGLVRLQLPQGKVIDRVRLDLLPTSRPCWVPGRPETVLFAAGDGRLHHFEFAAQAAADEASEARPVDGDSPLVPSIVAWNCPRPCKGTVSLTDPSWPGHPVLPHIVFATLIAAPDPSQPGSMPPNRLCWLKMNEGGTRIEAAGNLTETTLEGEGDQSNRRFPDLAVGPDGSLHLVYLSRGKTRGNRLEALPIEVDPDSGCPRVAAGARPGIIASDLVLAPPVVSADRRAVYGISKTTGHVVKHPILAQTDLATR